MNVALFLARRFLSGRRGGLLGAVSRLALAGVALGTAALVVAMGLMSGYRGELAEKLAGTNAEVLAIPNSEVPDRDIRASLAALPGVVAVARTAFAPGLLLSERVPLGVDVLLKALDLPSGLRTTRLLGSAGTGEELARAFASVETGERPALLGRGLAERLGVGKGSRVVVETATAALSRGGLTPPRRLVLRVSSILDTGFSEVDDGWAVVPLSAFDELAPPDARQGIYELRLTSPNRSDGTVKAARSLFGPEAMILDWKTLNRDLFEALLLQQLLLFLILFLIVAVAAGTVVSAVVVLVAAKTREAGLLAAVGATPRLLVRTFGLSGFLLGAGGIAAGLVFGVLACAILTTFRLVRFAPEIAKVYYLTWMPFRPEPLHLAAISFFGLLLVLAASLFPARRAARLLPAEALRYE